MQQIQKWLDLNESLQPVSETVENVTRLGVLIGAHFDKIPLKRSVRSSAGVHRSPFIRADRNRAQFPRTCLLSVSFFVLVFKRNPSDVRRVLLTLSTLYRSKYVKKNVIKIMHLFIDGTTALGPYQNIYTNTILLF